MPAEDQPADAATGRSDRGLTHVAFLVGDLDASLAFYATYARMRPVHRRTDGGARVAWITDGTRPFVLVLVEVPRWVPRPALRAASSIMRFLRPFEHLGVGCESRVEVDRLAAAAKAEGRLQLAPKESGPPVGYWAFLTDPDGRALELSYGQEVGLTVARAASSR